MEKNYYGIRKKTLPLPEILLNRNDRSKNISPVGINKPPVRLSASPVRVNASPVRINEPLVGISASSVRINELPVRVNASPVRLNASSVRISTFPVRINEPFNNAAKRFTKFISSIFCSVHYRIIFKYSQTKFQ
ncbi:MAG: hypothetical protein LBK96_01850, partial [Prevotellaceae bacterium]|nr:hypothetical protein [Prevotellaceae bacterium]